MPGADVISTRMILPTFREFIIYVRLLIRSWYCVLGADPPDVSVMTTFCLYSALDTSFHIILCCRNVVSQRICNA